jgi:hypothetical protein
MKQADVQALHATLAELGATPARVRALVEASRADCGGVDSSGVLGALHEFLAATDILGKTAHRVLGHVPDAVEYTEPKKAEDATGARTREADTLLARLTFLREHIVSTINVQGAEVWQRTTEEGRPLQEYAEDLARTDAVLLARLREVTRCPSPRSASSLD